MSTLLRRKEALADEKLGNLDGVGGGTFAEVVGHTPEIEAVLDRRVTADTPYEDLVLAPGVQRHRIHVVCRVVLEDAARCLGNDASDIGKVKIPNWLRKYTDKELTFEFCQGSDFPEDLEKYALVIHCGACMLNRREMVHRIKECAGRGVPITNYGLAISKTQGVLERAIRPLGLSL